MNFSYIAYKIIIHTFTQEFLKMIFNLKVLNMTNFFKRFLNSPNEHFLTLILCQNHLKFVLILIDSYFFP